MAELVAIAAPADQAEGTEMVVGTWLKHVGDSVTQNEPLVEITTDKVTVEIAAPATGSCVRYSSRRTSRSRPVRCWAASRWVRLR